MMEYVIGFFIGMFGILIIAAVCWLLWKRWVKKQPKSPVTVEEYLKNRKK